MPHTIPRAPLSIDFLIAEEANIRSALKCFFRKTKDFSSIQVHTEEIGRRAQKLAPHRLADVYIQRNGNVPGKGYIRTKSESRALEKHKAELIEAVNSRNTSLFLSEIQNASESVNGKRVHIRTTDIFLTSNKSAEKILLPPAALIPETIEKLQALLYPLSSPDPYKAIIALCVFINSHPYPDTNGRISRILFNLCLGCSGQTYIPLYEINRDLKGSQIINYRELEIFGNWNGIVKYFGEILAQAME